MTDQYEGPLNHRMVLAFFHLLKRVSPTGATVTGRQEVTRLGDLVFTITLHPTQYRGDFDGLILRTVNPAVGELDVSVMIFADFGVTTGTGEKRPLEHVDYFNAARLTDGVDTSQLERVVRAHLAAWTGFKLS